MALPPNEHTTPYVRLRAAPLAVALFIVLLSFLPIANWIAEGHRARWYLSIADEFLNGTTIALGLGVVLAILSRKGVVPWRRGAMDGLVAEWDRRPVLFILAVSATALLLYLLVSLAILGGRPLNIDEVVQLFQARIYAGGHLTLPTFAYPEFFSSLHLVDTQGRVYSQFPAGGPAMLALGELVHAPWVVDPIFGAVGVVAFAVYARRAEPRPGTALAATLIFAFAPFAVFMSGSHMNHVTALAWIMIGMAAMAIVMTAEKPRPVIAALSGFGFGMAATIRPVDALAFALPAAAWFLVRALRDRRRWLDALPSAAGVALPLVALMLVNSGTTGAPLLFGYEVLWGDSHRLGFHAAPWGMSHTPVGGLELINIYFLQLQTYFLETPIPSLTAAIGALALSKRFGRFDRYLLTSAALLTGLYFSYWFDGFYLGPRFMYPLLAPLAIWTARFFPLMRQRFGVGFAYRTTVYTAACALLIAAIVDVPMRARQYSNGLSTMRWDADSAAARSGVQDALVLVRESWGAQLVSRLWALGVPRSETELLYWNIDACALEHAIGRLESTGTRGMAAYEAISPILHDSTYLIGSPVSPDTSEQYLPGSRYSPRCMARIVDDRAGFTLFAPLLLAQGGGNVYARDLHGRDTLLLSAYSHRPIYLLKPATSEIGEPPRFYPLSRDSLERAWRAADH